ncbi:MAG: twin transmembrane helix small protein [Legionellales bacterium]|nr:twin transmembrane helix small protein [Legionellales bacterium]
MLAKFIIIAIMLIILYSLGSGLYYLVRDEGKTKRTVKSLTWRIVLSLSLFFLLLLGYLAGWWQPHGIYSYA